MAAWLRIRALVAALLAGGGGGCAPPRPEDRAPAEWPSPNVRVESNLLRRDYAGSAECQACHPEIYEGWKRSPMHRMTRSVDAASIEAPFDGATFRIQSDSITMEARGGQRFMQLVSTRQGERLFRITRVIGGRYREDFAGIDVTEAIDPEIEPGRGPELIMPVSYVLPTRSWRYKGYSVLVRERPGLAAGPRWAQVCIGCHNTLPYLTYLYDELHGPGAPAYQGSPSDHLLPPARAWQVDAIDAARLKREVVAELALLGGGSGAAVSGSLQSVTRRAIDITRQRLRGTHLVEEGIGCEACHGGAREHVEDSAVLPSFAVRSPLLRLAPADGREASRAGWINRTCARCHTVLFSGYPWTWEGGHRTDPLPGGSSINSGEARDFALGGCANAMACSVCHDPHAEDGPERARALELPSGNRACLGCHPRYESKDALRAHSHHAPDGPGSACIACHMARKNMGLGYELTRYHRIGSPSDRERVERDRPLECALCHADRSVGELVSTMERWWGKRYDRAALRALYGDDPGVNILDATLARGKAHEQAVAIAVLGDQRDASAVPQLAPHLAHEYPLVRYYARRAIEKIAGEPPPVDVNAPAHEVRAQVQAWLSSRSPRR